MTKDYFFHQEPQMFRESVLLSVQKEITFQINQRKEQRGHDKAFSTKNVDQGSRIWNFRENIGAALGYRDIVHRILTYKRDFATNMAGQ